MTKPSQRLEAFIAEQNRLDSETPEERIQEQDKAKLHAQTFFQRVVMPALSDLAADIEQHSDRTAHASILSNPESDDHCSGELRIEYPEPAADGRRLSEFVCHIEIRLVQETTSASMTTTPQVIGGEITSKPYKTQALELDSTNERIANTVLDEYLVVSGKLRELVRNRSPRPARSRW